MLIAGWFFAGLVGNLLVWKVDALLNKTGRRCPTPRAVAACAAFSFLGPVAFVIAFFGAIVCLLMWLSDKPKRESWWTKPLCD